MRPDTRVRRFRRHQARHPEKRGGGQRRKRIPRQDLRSYYSTGVTPKVPSYLVFESTEPTEPEFTGSMAVYRGSQPAGRPIQSNPGQYVQPPPRALYGYECIGAVKAADETAAARAVVSATRRLTKLAIVPAVFIDFTADESSEPDTERAQLNP